jgi:hypothetical protein
LVRPSYPHFFFLSYTVVMEQPSRLQAEGPGGSYRMKVPAKGSILHI